jgi:hypothetical protein
MDERQEETSFLRLDVLIPFCQSGTDGNMVVGYTDGNMVVGYELYLFLFPIPFSFFPAPSFFFPTPFDHDADVRLNIKQKAEERRATKDPISAPQNGQLQYR